MLEVFSTHVALQLRPVESGHPPKRVSWDVLPGQTKTVLELVAVATQPGTPPLLLGTRCFFVCFFHPARAGHVHGLVNVRTSKGLLFVRVDLHVVAQGLYLPVPKLEFHTLTSPRQTKRLRVRLYNSGPGAVVVTALRPEVASPSLECHFVKGQTLAPGTELTIGKVEFRGVREGVFSVRCL